MNKKQLKISLVILGMFAVAVICIGLLSGNKDTESTDNVIVAYSQEVVDSIENIEGTEIGSINNFKDGNYKIDQSDGAFNITVVELKKHGNVIEFNTSTSGFEKYIGIAKSVKKYNAAETFAVTCVKYEEFSGNSNVSSREDLVNKIKNGTINSDNVQIYNDLITIKVTNDGNILIDDNKYIEYKPKKSERMTEDERKEYEAWLEEVYNRALQYDSENTVEENLEENENTLSEEVDINE